MKIQVSVFFLFFFNTQAPVSVFLVSMLYLMVGRWTNVKVIFITLDVSRMIFKGGV